MFVFFFEDWHAKMCTPASVGAGGGEGGVAPPDSVGAGGGWCGGGDTPVPRKIKNNGND